jgi:hypothetical protein
MVFLGVDDGSVHVPKHSTADIHDSVSRAAGRVLAPGSRVVDEDDTTRSIVPVGSYPDCPRLIRGSSQVS